MREVSDRRLNSLGNFFCAGTAAAASRYSVNALSVAKIMAQTGTPGGKMGISRSAYWIWKLHGIEGYGRTATLASTRLFLHYGIAFGVYDRLVKLRPPTNIRDSVLTSFVCGALAGPAATLVTHPLDLVKVRLTIQPSYVSEHLTSLRPWYPGNFSNTVQTIAINEGLYRGVFRGLGISLIGSSVYYGWMFGLWDAATQFSGLRPNKKAFPIWIFEWLSLPLVAVATATFISHPFDVIRRKYMAQSYVLPREGNIDIKFRNLFQCVTQIWKTSFFYGYYHGLVPNIMKVFPQVLGFFLIYKGTQGTLLTAKGAIEHPFKNFAGMGMYD